jgi:hypothetical protein
MNDFKERIITCKGCNLKLTEENKDNFVKKSGNRGISNQCKPCRNKENRDRYNAKKEMIKGCVYKEGTRLVTKVYSY